MPRRSSRWRMLRDLREVMQVAAIYVACQDSSTDDELLDDFESDSDSSDLCSEGTLDELDDDFADIVESSDDEGEQMLQIIACTYGSVLGSRYVEGRLRIPKASDFRFTYFLDLPDYDFRVITHLSKQTFQYVLSLIQDNPIFHNNSTFAQAPVHWQLACTLDRLGNDEQGVSLARTKLIWGLGHGTVSLYYTRCLSLFSLRHQFISWPGRLERQQISLHMEFLGFKGCVGLVDGTLIPLRTKPSWHGNNYFDRKKQYSINAQILCDHRHQIRHVITGNSGASHDSGIFSNSLLVEAPRYFFSPGQYLLSDSAYAASSYLVLAYRRRARDVIEDPLDQVNIERFNTYLAQARVANEHTIGVWKARWSSLRGMRINLEQEDDLEKIIRHVVVCCLLHNIALDRDSWQDDVHVADDSLPDEGAGLDPPRAARRTPGQQKRLQVRRACLEFFDNQDESE